MSTVSINQDEVNHATYEEVVKWHLLKAERGEVPQVTARLRNTALMQLVSVLGADEPKDPAWLHSNISEIGKRWAIRKSANSATAQSYIARSRAALADWLAFKSDPTKFRFKVQFDGKVKEKKPKAKSVEMPAPEVTHQPAPVVLAEPQQPAPSPAPPSPVFTMTETFRTFPLGQGREPLLFKSPTDLCVNDVRKIAFHLLSLAHDFDPAVPIHAQMFAVVSQREQP